MFDGTATADDSYGSGISHLTINTNDAGGSVVNVPYLAAATQLRVNGGSGGGDTFNFGGGFEGQLVTDAVACFGGSGNTFNITTDGDEAATATLDPGTGSGNTVNVGLTSTLTLARVTGVHTLTVNQLNIDSSGTAILNDPTTAADIEVTSGGTLTANAASTIGTLNNSGTVDILATATITTLEQTGGGGTDTFSGSGNTSTIATVNAPTSTLNVQGAAAVTANYVESIQDANVDAASLTIGVGHASGTTAWGSNNAVVVSGSYISGTLAITENGIVTFAEITSG